MAIKVAEAPAQELDRRKATLEVNKTLNNPNHTSPRKEKFEAPWPCIRLKNFL